MAEWLAIASLLLSGCALLASIYILGFAIYGVSLRRKIIPNSSPASQPPFFLVLVPAHDEALGIASTIQSIRVANYPPERIRTIVIADNCTDETAATARLAGAQVIERRDLSNPGKGQALAWAFANLPAEGFDFATVIDADTSVDKHFFAAIASHAAIDRAESSAVVYQGRYDFAAAANDKKSEWFEILTLASKAAENSFSYLPRSAAGLVTLLQGNGFCISRAALKRVPFDAGSIVEDAEYAIHLALAGVPVRYVDKARVLARMTNSVSDAAPQRLRWASGIFALIANAVPRLLRAGIARRSWRLAEAAIMLLFTSRVFVAIAGATALAFAFALLPNPLARMSLVIAVSAFLLQLSYIFLMFRKAADCPFPLTGLFWAPVYLVLISVTQALAATGFKRKRWARTVR